MTATSEDDGRNGRTPGSADSGGPAGETERLVVRTLTVPPFAENSFLVGDPADGTAVLMDPGGRVPELLEIARELGMEIAAIWLTHAHADHVAGVAEARRRTGVPVLLHPEDRFLYDATAEQGAAFGLDLEAPPPPDGELSAGQSLGLGTLEAEVLHVPGHSPGHVAFWFPAAQVVFSGDCLFAGSIGRTDLPGGSHDVLMRSIRRELFTLGDGVHVYPGHGPPTTVGRERRDNPFFRD